MKKAVILILVFCILFSVCVSAYAQESLLMSADIIGAVTYALMTDWGISFTAVNASGAGMEGWMQQTLGTYQTDKGHSLIELFGQDQARMLAGKLVVSQTMYNGVKDFVSWMGTKFGLSGTEKALSEGKYNDMYLPIELPGDEQASSSGVSVTFDTQNDYPPWDIGYRHATVFYNGAAYFEETTTGAKIYDGEYSLTIAQDHGNYVLSVVMPYHYYNTGQKRTQVVSITSAKVVVVDGLSWNGSQYVEPTVLNPDKAWSGLIGGQDWPDINLDQLVGKIYDDLSRDLLDVDGEIIDSPPAPTPTPFPVDPDTPLQNVPWEGLNDLIGHTGESINEQIQSQTQSVTSAQEETTEAVESLTDTISGALDVPDAQELPDFKFDLRELFPFCIPFDIYRLLSSFDAEPQAPHVQLPIVIQSIGFSYNLDLDFSSWNPVAQAMRTAELIVYAIALAWATGKVIKW